MILFGYGLVFLGGGGMVYVVSLTFFCRYSGFLFLRKNLKFGWVEGGENYRGFFKGCSLSKPMFLTGGGLNISDWKQIKRDLQKRLQK